MYVLVVYAVWYLNCFIVKFIDDVMFILFYQHTDQSLICHNQSPIHSKLDIHKISFILGIYGLDVLNAGVEIETNLRVISEWVQRVYEAKE